MNAPMLPSVPDARLPRAYEAAQTALAECQQVDECKDWADKAAALASYAHQSKDESLERMAQRIRARAIRRAGELLAQIDGRGGDQSKKAVAPPFAQKQAAREAGFSPHQQKQAVRIAAVPDEDFERQIEAPKPPTLSRLAQQGIKPRAPMVDHKGRDPAEFNRAMHFVGTFEHYLRELGMCDIDRDLPGLIDSERVRLKEAINAIDAIHDRIMTRI